MDKVFTVRLIFDGQAPVVEMVDQRLLPTQTVVMALRDPEGVAEAITDMVVRGAPAIGVTAAYGIAQAALLAASAEIADFDGHLAQICARFAATRPTAVNLFWAIDRMRTLIASTAALTPAGRAQALLAESRAIHDEDIAFCLAMGAHGAALLPDRCGVLTHCNAGALATGGQGTALGVIRSAVRAGKRLHVWVDETRPYLQGARLTAWEMQQEGIEATLITDNMAAWMMKQGHIQAAIVGSDRIAANGDVSNKIGTYGVAILCRHHGIPLYVAAPTSTIDLACPHGDDIPIEERSAREVTHVGGWAPPELIPSLQVAPTGFAVRNPAFDVVPAELVSAIVTEHGVARAPYGPALHAMVKQAELARAQTTRATTARDS